MFNVYYYTKMIYISFPKILSNFSQKLCWGVLLYQYLNKWKVNIGHQCTRGYMSWFNFVFLKSFGALIWVSVFLSDKDPPSQYHFQSWPHPPKSIHKQRIGKLFFLLGKHVLIIVQIGINIRNMTILSTSTGKFLDSIDSRREIYFFLIYFLIEG